jgi:hypothetical protein
MDILSPPKACDPWAVHSAQTFLKGKDKLSALTPLQLTIVNYIKKKGEATLEELIQNLNPTEQALRREFAVYGMISEYRLAFLVTVVRLAMGKDLIGNCTHEPNLLGPGTGANLFWAEVGTNPRDTESETSKGRGMDVNTCMEMFKEADFNILQGPSMIYRENKNMQ